MSSGTVRTRTKDTKAAKKKAVVQELKHKDLLGEIITWNPGSTQRHPDVVAALTFAGLDEKVARELLPRHAFSRASRKMAEHRIIDLIKEDEGVLFFQFTQKKLEEEEWTFSKETVVKLAVETGKVECKDAAVQSLAQQLLDKAMEDRTTADITKIVQKLFEKESDLFPIRDQGGVYFVPKDSEEFTDKVETFINKLGGNINRFPVPAGTQNGDKAVQMTVAESLAQMIDEHKESVEGFTLTTRSDSFERMAVKINSSRTKLEAYAHYLGERQKELLSSIDKTDKCLQAKVAELAETRANAPIVTESKKESGGERFTVFGHSSVAVLRWMGKNAWSKKEAKLVFDEIAGVDAISFFTIQAQIQAGKKGERQPPAVLTDEQVEKLEDMRTAALEKVAKRKAEKAAIAA